MTRSFKKLAQKHSEYEAPLKKLSEATYLNLEDLQADKLPSKN